VSYLQAIIPVGRPAELPEQLAKLLDEFEVYWCGQFFALRCRQCVDRIGLYQTLSLTTFVSIALRHPAKCPSWPSPEPSPLEGGLDQFLYGTGAGS
jgi:hypothetical protein